MSNYPDFTNHGYQVIRELGRNREAGRITYLANTLPSPILGEGIGVLGKQNKVRVTQDQQVVIKEFRFAIVGADWSGFKAYQREIQLLQQLDHPRIPRYLDSFETAQGFCLVQEYKSALSLAERYSFTPEEIKQIAVSVLEILVYLQQRTPAVIHRDIKPENILVDKQLNAYLVDFGFARIRSGELALSSVAAGTIGFMPPEEHFGRSLTEASDLYSFGATLICLLTGTRSVDIGKLIDDNYRFDFKKLVPKLNPRFVQWLTKMVEPNLKKRYANAAVALESLLQSVQVVSHTSSLEIVRTITAAFVLLTSTVGFVALCEAVLLASRSHPPSKVIPQVSVASENSSFRQLLTTKSCLSCDLRGADLRWLDLRGADLWKADLRGADLRGVKLRGANLEEVNLEGVNLEGANLESANLGRANLRRANLKRTDLGRANLERANLESANLKRANLRRADLWDANLKGVNLKSADLKGTNLEDANLERANLENAYLKHAKLEGANLERANLKGAIIPDRAIHE